MKFTTYITALKDLEQCQKCKLIDSVLLEVENLSVRGWLSLDSAIDLARKAKMAGLTASLVCDSLLTEKRFEEISRILSKSIVQEFSSVRLRDIGLAAYLIEENPKIKIQLILDYGNHNLEGLKTWVSYFSNNLERIIISPQLTEEKIIEYLQNLNTDIEILGAGPLLFFSTPRKLLSPLDISSTEGHEILEAFASSEESSNRNFPIVESANGTFMYLDKDFFVLDRLDLIKQSGLKFCRVDLTQHSQRPNSAEGIFELLSVYEQDPKATKALWPRKTAAPFLRSNNTTAQFRRLKSHLHALKDEQAVATVVSIENGRCTLFAHKPFSFDEDLILALPSKEQKSVSKFSAQDIDGKQIFSARTEQIISTTKIKYATTGALIRRAI